MNLKFTINFAAFIYTLHMSCIFSAGVVDPVGDTEEYEGEREENPGGDINLLRIQLIMIYPAQEHILSLLQT